MAVKAASGEETEYSVAAVTASPGAVTFVVEPETAAAATVNVSSPSSSKLVPSNARVTVSWVSLSRLTEETLTPFMPVTVT